MRVIQATNSINTNKVKAAASSFGALRKSITATVAEARQMSKTTVELERGVRAGVTLSQKPQIPSVVAEFAHSVGDYKRVREASERQNLQTAVAGGLAGSGLEDTLAKMWPRTINNIIEIDKQKLSSKLVSLTREARNSAGSIYT